MGANKTKQTAISAGHILLLFVTFGIGLGALMAEPLEDNRWWFELFLISKTIAAAGFFAFWKLYSRWSKTDKWLNAYSNNCDKALEATNPCYIERKEEHK